MEPRGERTLRFLCCVRSLSDSLLICQKTTPNLTNTGTMNVAYTDPTLFEDLPDRVSLRLRARERSRVRLYVVEEGQDFATLIEAISQIASGHSTCVAIRESDKRSTSDKENWNKAMGYLATVASSRGVRVFTRVKAAVFEAVRRHFVIDSHSYHSLSLIIGTPRRRKR